MAYTLSTKIIGRVAMLTAQNPLCKELERLNLKIVTILSNTVTQMTALSIRPTLRDRTMNH